MPVTPADVHNVAFKKPPIGKRGYDEDEVDAFLDLVEAELARLLEENNDLRSQVDDVMSRPHPMHGSHSGQTGPQLPPPAQPPPIPMRDPMREPPRDPMRDSMEQSPMGPGGDHGQAVRMLALAQETAEKYVTDAKVEADRVMNEARAKSDHLLSEAHAKAESMMAESRGRADNLEREARAKVAAMTQEAERKHAEVMGGLEQRKIGLDKRIETLRTFEREYRTRLKSFLESHLRDLDSRGSAEPAQGPGPDQSVNNASSGSYPNPYGRPRGPQANAAREN